VTDRETLRTVLTELVENAVEHGVPATDGRGRRRAGDEAADGGQIVDGDAVESAGRGDATAPVRVRVEARPDAVVVVVEDDGPGVPEGELAVVETGEETALDHGSGLGLWLATWATERIGADLSFEIGDDGTTATLSLPRGSGDDPAADGTA